MKESRLYGWDSSFVLVSLYAFRLLSPVVQLYWVLKHGTLLAQRWEARKYYCARGIVDGPKDNLWLGCLSCGALGSGWAGEQ